MVANRIEKNLRRLKGWRKTEGIDCFRAYDAVSYTHLDVYKRQVRCSG